MKLTRKVRAGQVFEGGSVKSEPDNDKISTEGEETQVPPTWVSFYLATRAGVGTSLLTPTQPFRVGRCCKNLLCASEEGILVS